MADLESPRPGELARVGVLCLALGVAATYPLIRHLTEFLPSDAGDPVLNAWILAWDAARLHHGLARLWDAPNFFPYPHTLAYSDHLLGLAVFTAPIQWATHNPVLVYNLAFLASWPLTGLGMYVLARALTGRADAALVAAAACAFAPFRVAHLSHVQWMTLGWLPLSLWALHRYFRTGAWHDAVASALFFFLQAMTASYFVYFGLLPLACVAVANLRRTAVPPRRLATQAVVVALLLGAAVAPVARAYYSVRAAQGLHRTTDDVIQNSADVSDLLRASGHLRIWRVLPSGGSEHELFTGGVILVLALLGCAAAWRGSPVVPTYAAMAVVAFLLALGPSPGAWGHRSPLPGPYALLLAVMPGLDGLRAPGRIAVVMVLALAVLAAFGAAWAIDRTAPRHRRTAVALLVAAVVVEGWTAPLRLAAFDPGGPPRDRGVYAYLGSQPRGAVLELPTAIAAPMREFRYEYLTLVHNHPVVNGHSGYQSPLLEYLGGGHSPLSDTANLDAAFAMASALDVRYIVAHRGDPDGDPLCASLVEAAGAHPAQVLAVRDFGSAVVFSLPFAPLARAPAAARPIPANEIRATASDAADRLPFAFDGDPDSRWLSGGHQDGHEWIELALARPRDVAVVRMVMADRSLGDYPRRLVVEATGAGGTRTLYDGYSLPQLAAGIVANASYPAIDIVLPPNETRTLRLRQTGIAHTFFWSIHELQLLERPH